MLSSILEPIRSIAAQTAAQSAHSFILGLNRLNTN